MWGGWVCGWKQVETQNVMMEKIKIKKKRKEKKFGRGREEKGGKAEISDWKKKKGGEGVIGQEKKSKENY